MDFPSGMCRRSRFFVSHCPYSRSEQTHQVFLSFAAEHPTLQAVRRPVVCVGCTLRGQHTSNVSKVIKARGNVRWHNAEDSKIHHHHRILNGVIFELQVMTACHVESVHTLRTSHMLLFVLNSVPHCSQSASTTNAHSTETNCSLSVLLRLGRIQFAHSPLKVQIASFSFTYLLEAAATLV